MANFARLASAVSALLLACRAETIPGTGGVRLPTADIDTPDRGVPDRNDDPAVVLVVSATVPLCAGVLLAPDVVLTAWHCVATFPPSSSSTPRCPASSAAAQAAAIGVEPSSIHVLVGSSRALAVERASARAVVAPETGMALCAADIALLVLDQSIDDVAPLAVSPAGASEGARLRTVGFESGSGGAVTRFVRDHVPVVAAGDTTFDVDEGPCSAGCGGPALDESSGAVVGVASRSELSAGASAADVYVRADAFLGLVEEALARSAAAPASASSAALARAAKGAIDTGSACEVGSDCAAGACVSDGQRRYCTRSCSARDACPTHLRCEETSTGQTVCIEG